MNENCLTFFRSRKANNSVQALPMYSNFTDIILNTMEVLPVTWTPGRRLPESGTLFKVIRYVF